ncbi:MAG TPA: terminase small subunit [Gemmatimonadaceae bacterium]|nr:terminase small subunit [Gemmatimonadaceae bacterium]
MTPKQARFVAEYLVDLNATQAAIRAGYSVKGAETQGSALLRNPQVSAAIAAGKAMQLDQADLTATRILEELRRLALNDPRQFFDADGRLRPVTEWTAEMGAVLAGMDVDTDRDGDTVVKVKFWSKTAALDTLAKHFGLLLEKVQHSGGVELTWKE